MNTQRWIAFTVIVSVMLAPTLATAQEATPQPSISVETLGSVIMPAEAFPPGEAFLFFGRETIPPGQSLQMPQCAAHSVGAATVVGGESTLHGGDVKRVWRKDGTVEDPASSTDVTIHVGDSYLTVSPGPAWASTSTGSEPAVTLAMSISDDQSGTCDTNDVPPGYNVDVLGVLYPIAWAMTGLGTQPVTATFRQTTLAPGATIVTTAVDPVIMRYVDNGRVTRTIEHTGVTATPTSPQTLDRFSWVPWSPLEASEQSILTNQETEPAILLELVLSPAEAGTGTPTT